MTAHEPIDAKAGRLLVVGALTVTEVNGAGITAICRGDNGVYALGHHLRVTGGWWCGCPARSTCAHLTAPDLASSAPRAAI